MCFREYNPPLQMTNVEQETRKLAQIQIDIIFLSKCKQMNIIPNELQKHVLDELLYSKPKWHQKLTIRYLQLTLLASFSMYNLIDSFLGFPPPFLLYIWTPGLLVPYLSSEEVGYAHKNLLYYLYFWLASKVLQEHSFSKFFLTWKSFWSSSYLHG